MKCRICGYELSQDRSYCPMCGTAVPAGTIGAQPAAQDNMFKAAGQQPAARSVASDMDFSWNTVDFPKPRTPQDIKMRWTMSAPEEEFEETISVMNGDASEGYVRTPAPSVAHESVEAPKQEAPQPEEPQAQPAQARQAASGAWQMPIWYTQPLSGTDYPQRFTASGVINIEPMAQLQQTIQNQQAAQQTNPGTAAPVSKDTMPRGLDDAWLDEQLAQAHAQAPAEQFPTFVRKNEEFQQLLNQEYERASSLNAVAADSASADVVRFTHADIYGKDDVVQASDISAFERMLMEGTQADNSDNTLILNREKNPEIIKTESEYVQQAPLEATQVIAPAAVIAAAAAGAGAVKTSEAEAPAAEELKAEAFAPAAEESKKEEPAASEDPLAKMPAGDISWSKMLEEMEAEKIAAAANKKAAKEAAAAEAAAKQEEPAEAEKPAEPEIPAAAPAEEQKKPESIEDFLAKAPGGEAENSEEAEADDVKSAAGLAAAAAVGAAAAGIAGAVSEGSESKEETKRLSETFNRDTIEMKLAELRRREKAEENLRSERRKKLDEMAKARDEFFVALDENKPAAASAEETADKPADKASAKAAAKAAKKKEQEEDFLRPRRGHGFFSFILVILIIVGLLWGAVWGINKFAPDSIASDIANQFTDAAKELVDKGVDKANEIISFYTGKKLSTSNEKQESLDTSALGEDEQFDFKAIVSSADSEGIIKKVSQAAKLKPESYGGTSLADAEVIDDDTIREAIYRLMVAYNASWVKFVNEGDSKCLEYLKSDGSAYKNAVKYDQIGEVTETFESLELGEIRYDGTYYYICDCENITIEPNDSSDGKSVSVSDMVYRIVAVDKNYKIVDYEKVDKAN